ncbi:hypothetical protein FDC58_16490 [Clostridium botulinum]|uniref:hypothetical protein n=1 Tax=unclassified Clostridium TaxID=2614128 RepID=UPI0005069FFC|nr:MULTISPECIES: hypothetical protein [unclassified Clostridium]AIY79584.1 hypothetical protein U728_2259 [Clostridium botulinum 202F]KAI3347419.1 hypothetical protein CIT17_04005 [Clostridium botulinum]KFX57529.1 hypothetical protein KU41_09390 [Clostridium botulinum]KFX59781.1 hypothetical protein KU40_01985 [Clostridium botulinum]KON14184.1 hypothetical protein ACP50_01345 [Clostridium botulinum]
MGKVEFLNKLNEINSVVCIAEFGSYRTEYWIKDRYTHDYYQKEPSEKQVEDFCFQKLAYLEIFSEESKENVILKYKDNSKKN